MPPSPNLSEVAYVEPGQTELVKQAASPSLCHLVGVLITPRMLVSGNFDSACDILSYREHGIHEFRTPFSVFMLSQRLDPLFPENAGQTCVLRAKTIKKNERGHPHSDSSADYRAVLALTEGQFEVLDEDTQEVVERYELETGDAVVMNNRARPRHRGVALNKSFKMLVYSRFLNKV